MGISGSRPWNWGVVVAAEGSLGVGVVSGLLGLRERSRRSKGWRWYPVGLWKLAGFDDASGCWSL